MSEIVNNDLLELSLEELKEQAKNLELKVKAGEGRAKPNKEDYAKAIDELVSNRQEKKEEEAKEAKKNTKAGYVDDNGRKIIRQKDLPLNIRRRLQKADKEMRIPVIVFDKKPEHDQVGLLSVSWGNRRIGKTELVKRDGETVEYLTKGCIDHLNSQTYYPYVQGPKKSTKPKLSSKAQKRFNIVQAEGITPDELESLKADQARKKIIEEQELSTVG